MSRVAGKIALVTGGARGIGHACAELLSAEGATVVVSDRDAQEGQKVVDGLSALGRQALFVEHDVSEENRWQHVINVCVSKHGRLDILVNNAGVGWVGDVEHTTLEDWHKLLSVNLDGVFLGIKHAIPAMRIGGAGAIINLSSIEGPVGDPTLAAYNASKGAVRLLSKSASASDSGAAPGVVGRMIERDDEIDSGPAWNRNEHQSSR